MKPTEGPYSTIRNSQASVKISVLTVAFTPPVSEATTKCQYGEGTPEGHFNQKAMTEGHFQLEGHNSRPFSTRRL